MTDACSKPAEKVWTSSFGNPIIGFQWTAWIHLLSSNKKQIKKSTRLESKNNEWFDLKSTQRLRANASLKTVTKEQKTASNKWWCVYRTEFGRPSSRSSLMTHQAANKTRYKTHIISDGWWTAHGSVPSGVCSYSSELLNESELQRITKIQKWLFNL